DELLRQFERFFALIGIQPQHEIRLHIWDIAQNRVDVIGDLPDLFYTRIAAGLRLVSQLEPGLDSRQNRHETVVSKPLQMRLAEQREAAFRDEAHPPQWYGILDCRHVIVESDPEIRVMPCDRGSLQLVQEEAQILPDLLEAHRLVVDHGI